MTDSTKLPLTKILNNAEGIYALLKGIKIALDYGVSIHPESAHAEILTNMLDKLDSQPDPNKIDTTEAQAMADALAIQLEKP